MDSQSFNEKWFKILRETMVFPGPPPTQTKKNKKRWRCPVKFPLIQSNDLQPIIPIIGNIHHFCWFSPAFLMFTMFTHFWWWIMVFFHQIFWWRFGWCLIYPLVNQQSLRTGTSPFFSAVNQRTKWVMASSSQTAKLSGGNSHIIPLFTIVNPLLNH